MPWLYDIYNLQQLHRGPFVHEDLRRAAVDRRGVAHGGRGGDDDSRPFCRPLLRGSLARGARPRPRPPFPRLQDWRERFFHASRTAQPTGDRTSTTLRRQIRALRRTLDSEMGDVPDDLLDEVEELTIKLQDVLKSR